MCIIKSWIMPAGEERMIVHRTLQLPRQIDTDILI